MARHLALASMSSAAIDRMSGMYRFWGRPRPAMGQIIHIGRVYLEVPRNTDRPSKLASREPLAERRAQPTPGIRQHAAETYTSRDRPIDLRQSDLRLGPRRSIVGRYTRSLQPSLIARPTLGKKQPQ